MENYQKFLDPRTLAKVRDLEIKAHQVIEGLVAGAHKSPYQGISIEFAQHREYVVGDDTRHIDWKVFAKTDKFYLKQYEQETNLVCNLALDASESMNYSSGKVTKLDYAAQLAATVAYLVLHQQDSAGMVHFEDRIKYQIHPSGQPSHLKQIMHLLGSCQPGNVRSEVGKVLDELAERLKKRSLVMVISDCFDDVDRILAGLRHLRYKRHEVVVFQILDPAEMDFPFQQITKFKGLESFPELLAEPRALRKAYQEEFGKFLRELESGCRSVNVQYRRVRTDEPLERMLASFLGGRE